MSALTEMIRGAPVVLTGHVLLVGLTGGIGAGKTAVSAQLAARGALIIDSDVLAREVVAPGTPGLAEVVDVFGAGVLAADSSSGGPALDRSALGRVVFSGSALDNDAARRRLEAIIHPRVRARAAELAAAAPRETIVVNDVPLLVETGLAPTFHIVLVVRSAESTRVARLVRYRRMTEDEAYARIRAQASDAERAAAADVVLPNDGGLAELAARVDLLWTERLVPYEVNVRRCRPVWPAHAPVVPYDPTWPAQYARLAARIAHAAGPAALGLEHTGPTAVPGRPAADILDIRLSVADAEAVGDELAAAGFPCATEDLHRSAAEGARGSAVERLHGSAVERLHGSAAELLHGSADPGRPINLYVRADA